MQAFDSLWHWDFWRRGRDVEDFREFVTRLAGPVVKTFVWKAHRTLWVCGGLSYTNAKPPGGFTKPTVFPRPACKNSQPPRNTPNATAPPPKFAGRRGAHGERRIPAAAPRDRACLKYRYTRRCIYPLSPGCQLCEDQVPYRSKEDNIPQTELFQGSNKIP